jgi:hypothetical protein
VPTVDNVYDLGATGLRFRDLHVGGSTIYLGDTVSLSAANDGTVTLGNANGNVSLISAGGVATYYGKGTTSGTVTNSNTLLLGYEHYFEVEFPKQFSNIPTVIVSLNSSSEETLPPVGTMIVAANVSEAGFEVYSDIIVGYNWTASENNSA